MKLTINFGASDNQNPLFYALLAKSGSSIPTKNASQWYYEVGKALYYMGEKELFDLVNILQTHADVEIDNPNRS